MVEYGESFWRNGWAPLYSVLGGNPLAAMPSLHFATSAMARARCSPRAVRWRARSAAAYAAVLGFALVYLGEHYVVDLLGGLALTLAVRRPERVAARRCARSARSSSGSRASRTTSRPRLRSRTARTEEREIPTARPVALLGRAHQHGASRRGS